MRPQAGWPRAPERISWRLPTTDALASFGLLPRGPARPAASWLLRAWLGGSLPRTHSSASRRLSQALTFGPFVAGPELLPRWPSRPAADRPLRAWLGGFSPRTPSRPSCFCRAGPRAPRQAGSFEPGSAASRRGRLRVLHASAARARAPRGKLAPLSLAWRLAQKHFSLKVAMCFSKAVVFA